MGRANRDRVRAWEDGERARGQRFLTNAEIRSIEKDTGRIVILDVGAGAVDYGRASPELGPLAPHVKQDPLPDVLRFARAAAAASRRVPVPLPARLPDEPGTGPSMNDMQPYDPTVPRKVPPTVDP